MKTTTKQIALGLVLIAFGLSVLVYARLPESMPGHFDLHGQVDGYLPRALGAFLLPGVLLAVHALFVILAARAVDAERAISTVRVLEILHLGLLAFLLILHGVVLGVALGASVEVSRIVFGALGLLLAILGNYLGKLRRNAWIGIRTPWTLSDDEIWARTHRLAGPLFVIGGSLLFVASLRGPPASALPIALIPMVLVPSIYSYLLARRRDA